MANMPEPDYVVIRTAVPGTIPADFDGRWIDRATVRVGEPNRMAYGLVTWTLRPTGRFEVRDDGTVAEVWEAEPDVR